MKPERPEDIAYRAKLVEQQHAEEAMGQIDTTASQDALLSVFQSLTKVLKDNNQHLQSNDVTEPTKFNGLDTVGQLLPTAKDLPRSQRMARYL